MPGRENALLYHSGVVWLCRTGSPGRALLLAATVISVASGQVIGFLSNGLSYQTLTRKGLTVMYAPLPMAVGDFAVFQVAFSNGSGQDWLLQPTNFFFESDDGRQLQAVSEYTVIYELYRSAGHSEVVKLQTAYEQAIYQNHRIRSNNGYEQRRRAALAFGPKGVKAAAAASAIALVRTKLRSGDSTDGVIFFTKKGKDLGPGRIVARIGEEKFEFLSSSLQHSDFN